MNNKTKIFFTLSIIMNFLLFTALLVISNIARGYYEENELHLEKSIIETAKAKGFDKVQIDQKFIYDTKELYKHVKTISYRDLEGVIETIYFSKVYGDRPILNTQVDLAIRAFNDTKKHIGNEDFQDTALVIFHESFINKHRSFTTLHQYRNSSTESLSMRQAVIVANKIDNLRKKYQNDYKTKISLREFYELYSNKEIPNYKESYIDIPLESQIISLDKF